MRKHSNVVARSQGRKIKTICKIDVNKLNDLIETGSVHWTPSDETENESESMHQRGPESVSTPWRHGEVSASTRFGVALCLGCVVPRLYNPGQSLPRHFSGCSLWRHPRKQRRPHRITAPANFVDGFARKSEGTTRRWALRTPKSPCGGAANAPVVGSPRPASGRAACTGGGCRRVRPTHPGV